MGKFQTDTCPRHIFIILPGMITPSTFATFTLTLLPCPTRKREEEIASTISPKNKKRRELHPPELPFLYVPFVIEHFRTLFNRSEYCGLAASHWKKYSWRASSCGLLASARDVSRIGTDSLKVLCREKAKKAPCLIKSSFDLTCEL